MLGYKVNLKLLIPRGNLNESGCCIGYERNVQLPFPPGIQIVLLQRDGLLAISGRSRVIDRFGDMEEDDSWEFVWTRIGLDLDRRISIE